VMPKDNVLLYLDIFVFLHCADQVLSCL
jgi:hypothetical protein